MRELLYTDSKEIRLDSFLEEKFPSLTFSKLNQYLRENKIKVNKKKVPLSTRLHSGDIVYLYILDDVLDKTVSIALDVVYEDSNILIVNKPAGLIVQDENNPDSDSLLNRAKAYLKSRDDEYKDLVLCHRLDTGTSGIVILAKNEDAENTITTLIRLHKIQKEYRCITYGIPKEREGTIDNYLLKDSKTGQVKQYAHEKEGAKRAVSEYYVANTNNEYALINVKLLTGRTHQIRVHMVGLHCPIVGDSKYGNNLVNRKTKQKRQLLCAYKIKFPYMDGKYSNISNKEFTIKIPDNFAAFMAM